MQWFNLGHREDKLKKEQIVIKANIAKIIRIAGRRQENESR